MKFKSLGFLLLWPCLAHGTTYTAASNAESDVVAAIALASNGDTVQIPCTGTQTVIWTNTLSITANIKLTALGGTPNSGPSTFGAGTNCLTIRHNVGSFAPLFQLTPTYSATNNLLTVENINIDPFTASTALGNPFVIEGTGAAGGMPQVRLDNIIFGNSVQWNETGNTYHSVQMILVDNVVGVVDHSTIPATAAATGVELSAVQMSSYLGVGLWGDNSWAQPDSMGGANNWFEENNVINLTSLVLNDCTESGPSYSNSGGCRVVNRFNHVTENSTFALTGVHGLDTAGRPRSGRHTETYGNTVSCTNGGCGDAFASFRGGTGILFGNTATTSGTGSYGQLFDATPYRVVYNSSGWGGCGDATSGSAYGPTDTGDGVAYYSGTMTSGTTTNTMVDSTKSWTTNQFIPTGAPYDVWDVTQGFIAEITSNTGTSATVIAGIPEQANSFSVGDSYQIRRATVCTDQAGRGQGNYVSGSPNPSPASPVNQALDPMYDWDNSVSPSSTLGAQVGTYSGRVIINRDYYTDNWKGRGQTAPTVQTSSSSPFNGSGASGLGVGWGTLANRPPCSSGCLTGVAYWATDQGTWNTSGNGFGQGTLYVFNGSAWAANYGGNSSGQPYVYPHPLDNGSLICGSPTQNGPNYSGSYNVPPTVLPLAIGFTSPTGGCNMFMTLDGSTPTCSSTAYAAQNISMTTVMRVIACQAGYVSSAVVGGTWTINNTSSCPDPTQIGPNYSGTYTVPPTTIPLVVGFNESNAGCGMHATFDGSTPTCSSTSYGGTTNLSSTETIRVIACQSGFSPSNVVGGLWTIIFSNYFIFTPGPWIN